MAHHSLTMMQAMPAYPGPPPQVSFSPAVSVAPVFGEQPQTVVCPYCHAHVLSRLDFIYGGLTFLLCGIFRCGCCWIPFLVKSVQDVDHYCPNCNSWLGCYRRI